MRAVIIAVGENAGFGFFRDRHPIGLLPLAGKPILQHLVEVLVGSGIAEFDLILSHLPQAVESFLGDGSRWGSRFRYHLTPDPARPYHTLRTILGDSGSPVLLAREDAIPTLPPLQPVETVWCGADGAWTGWAILAPADLAHLAAADTAEQFEKSLLAWAAPRHSLATVPCPLRTIHPRAYLASQAALLEGGACSLVLPGAPEAAPGIRVSRNVSLHPTARLTAPVFIGADCRIGAGARIGPNAVIGAGSVVDRNGRVANSVIFAGSYVGESLDVDHALVDHNRLVSLKLETEVTLTDQFLLGRITHTILGRWISRACRRAAGCLLLLAAAPLLGLTMLALRVFRRGPVVHYREAVCLPAEGLPEQWRTFRIPAFRSGKHAFPSLLMEVIPGLAAVAAGHLALVGVEPRDRSQVLALAPDWRSLYLHSKPGLITEASVHCPGAANSDELFAAEAYYAAVAGFSHDLRLLCSYIAQSATGERRAASEALSR